MKRIFSFILTAFAAFTVASAVIVQRVELKNGSVLEGYIQSQDGSGKMTVHTDKAVIFINSANAEVFDRQVKAGNLDKVWEEWAKKNDAFTGSGDSRTLTLNDVTFKYDPADSVKADTNEANFEEYLVQSIRTVSNVKVLERGVTVKYLELTPNSYVVSWDDIKAVKADRRPKTALSGINRIYELKNGKSYEGQYAEETNNTLSLYMNSGIVQSFNIEDVVKYTFRPINPTQDIFEQSELTDVITTRRGSIIRGIILEQNYSSKKDDENLFLIQTPAGAIQTIKVSEIAELRKEENTKYAPQFDIMLNEGEVVVNRQPASFVKVNEEDDILRLDSIGKLTISAAANGLTQLTVEYRMENSVGMDVFQLVRVTKSKVKKQEVFSFSYKDLVNAVYRPQKVETSVNKTTKAIYEVPGKGLYALYDAKRRKAIPLIIE